MPHVEALCFPQTGYGLAAKGVYLGALMYRLFDTRVPSIHFSFMDQVVISKFIGLKFRVTRGARQNGPNGIMSAA